MKQAQPWKIGLEFGGTQKQSGRRNMPDKSIPSTSVGRQAPLSVFGLTPVLLHRNA
jgi:hypothetical protein